jgi:purine nucleoside phosphorylase
VYPGPVRIAVIGGTGLQTLPGFVEKATLNFDTPWGKPSSPITVLLHDLKDGSPPHQVAFLSRHGIHHELAPHEVNSRANISALRSIGVRTIIAFSAVGSLQEEIKPRDFFIPDQIIDRTKGIRPFTFFEGGVVGHVMFGDPFDENIAKIVRKCGHSLEGDGVRLHDKGTLVCMGMQKTCVGDNSDTDITVQKDHNSALVRKAIFTAPGAAASSTCLLSPKRSLPAKLKSLIK